MAILSIRSVTVMCLTREKLFSTVVSSLSLMMINVFFPSVIFRSFISEESSSNVSATVPSAKLTAALISS